jgi:hypothetical protein
VTLQCFNGPSSLIQTSYINIKQVRPTSYIAISDIVDKSLYISKIKYKHLFCKIYKSTYTSEVGFRCSDSPSEVKADAGRSGYAGPSEIPWDVVSSIEIESGVDVLNQNQSCLAVAALT